MRSFKYLAVCALAAVLTGCSMKEINLSAYSRPKSESVSHLLVDKSPNLESKAMIFMEMIDETSLDLLNDPCVYLIDPGEHRLLFRASDFFSGSSLDTKYTLKVTLNAGKFYQVIPRRVTDTLKVDFVEIDARKLDEVNRRQIKALIGYLFSDG